VTYEERVQYNKLVSKASRTELKPIEKLRLKELSAKNALSNKPVFIKPTYVYEWDIEELKNIRNGQNG